MNIIQTGNTFKVYGDSVVNVTDKLPSGTYVLHFDNDSKSYYLNDIDDMSVPEKLYGDTTEKGNRVFNTFKDRAKSTGVLLNGQKGSGKTMLAKYISKLCREEGIPTILINTSEFMYGDRFNMFIQSINQPVMILFDEFEKVFSRHSEQPELLTLLDGSFSTKKLFVFTSNNIEGVSTHMINRPGRVYYSFEYEKLDDDVLEAYVSDNMLNQDNVADVVKAMRMLSISTFDIMESVVEEMNRYDVSVEEVIQYLNVTPESNSFFKYTLTLKISDCTKVLSSDYKFNSMNFQHFLQLNDIPDEYHDMAKNCMDKDNPDEDGLFAVEDYYLMMGMQDFDKFDPKAMAYHFKRGTIELIVTQRENAKFGYGDLL